MDRAKALLEGGRVQRFHALPHTQPYTVAEHSWSMAMLLLALHPHPVPQRLLWACLTHDVAERWVGDTPAPAKWYVAPDLCHALEKAEHHINTTLGIDWGLNEVDRRWLKALDVAELMVYATDEIHRGNRFMAPTVAKCREVLNEEWVPEQVQKWCSNYTPLRTPDSFDIEHEGADRAGA